MKGQDLYRKARRLIPGGTQLLSKRPEMFLPEGWPSYYSSARGVEVVDLDGKHYTDMSIVGVGAAVLGYADPDVDAAVKRAIDSGVQSTLNCPEEVELAEVLCDLHPWAEMVRYTRSGGEAMAVAVRIARAHTRRDKIAFCGYHGWADWYLAANLAESQALDGQLIPGLDPAGVPRGLAGTAIPFRFNHAEDLDAIVAEYGSELAAIVMEPARDQFPDDGFLAHVRQLADRCGAILVFDEITSGFRMSTGGIHLLFGVDPDIAVFSKALGNGYAIAAIVGRSFVMEAAQSTFISSTNWTERIGPVAALATIRKFRDFHVADRLIETGKTVQAGWQAAAHEAGLDIHVSGIPPLAHFVFESANELAMTTLYTQLMLDRGFLAWSQFKAAYAHSTQDVDRYLQATCDVFLELAGALRDGTVESQLRGPVARRGFYRLA
jgi:glutamate-1-semialdehyde 2,1-aminomutase